MIALGDLIAPAGVVFDLHAANKRGLLLALAARAAALSGQDEGYVAEVILAREALGSTGFGAGTAIPHGRLETLPRIVAVIAKLDVPVDYAALDGLPVDLVVLMLAPTGAGAEHLKALARVSRALRDRDFCAKLRGSASADALYALVAGEARSEAA
jgi:PTS system nitrogen regulatory IIA component